MRYWVKFFIVLTLLVQVACTSTIPARSEIGSNQWPDKLSENKGWWYVRFRIDWPDEHPQWYMGALLAGEVVSPVLEKNIQDIDLWRFHRRAVHDRYEHVFSFIFYSSAQTARKIYQEISQDLLLVRLNQDKKVLRVNYDNPEKIARPNIEDTSDPAWPIEIQRTWPTFIMGASQMWLDLVMDFANNERNGQTEENLYKQVQNQITGLWMGHAKHAWLHHLNALYAYQPILMRY